MKEKFTITSNSNYGILPITFLAGIFFLILTLIIFQDASSREYTDIIDVVGVLFCGFTGIASIISIFFYEYFFLDSRKLTVRTFLGTTKKIIYLNEIIYYTEIQEKGKVQVWHKLTIYTSKSKQTLFSYRFKNYEEFKQILIKDKPKTVLETKLDRKTKIFNGGATCIATIILLFALFKVYTYLNKKVKEEEITVFSDIITNKLELYKRSRAPLTITSIHLKKFPGFAFELDGIAFNAASIDDILTYFEIGDTIFLGIKTKDYKMKLTKDIPLGFWDQHFEYDIINVYSISDNDHTYLTLENYNQDKLANKSRKILVIFFSLFIFSIFLYGFIYAFKAIIS